MKNGFLKLIKRVKLHILKVDQIGLYITLLTIICFLFPISNMLIKMRNVNATFSLEICRCGINLYTIYIHIYKLIIYRNSRIFPNIFYTYLLKLLQ